jgi:copper-binding protein NosD/flagellar hook capping protein FlgD
MSWLLGPRVTPIVVFGVLASCPVVASTVTVPDQYSTVQSAIDSGADTVLIREGEYQECPVVDRALVLQGIGTNQRPGLDGMHINNGNFRTDPPLLVVNRINFTGRVDQTTITWAIRNLQIAFSECSLDSGFLQILSTDPDDVASLSFTNCRMLHSSRARAYLVIMAADTIYGGVAWRAREPRIQNCWFRGGSQTAIELTDEPHAGMTTTNLIEDHTTGVFVDGGDAYPITNNTIIRCGTGISINHGYETDILDNTIRGCALGVSAIGVGHAYLRRNTIVGSDGVGLKAFTSGLVGEGNVIGKSGADAIVMSYPDESVLNRNTIFGSGGSGIVATLPGGSGYPVAITENIVADNAGWGLVVDNVMIELACNDWFGNGRGAVNGVAAQGGDVSVDPQFCDVGNEDVRVDSSSPLVGATGCGQIGALGVGCGVSATLVQRFTAGRVSEGVRVVWEVAEGATVSEIWLERSEASSGQAWTRPITERVFDSRAIVELDRSATVDRAYWYRLVALEGSDASVIAQPIVVEAQAPLEFRLVEVGPNPGSGPVRIAFALKHAAAIEIDVFDMQGRKVAAPGSGVWAAGTHELAWDGRTRNGQPAPAGMYVVRYLYPGGQDRRGIVRIR